MSVLVVHSLGPVANSLGPKTFRISTTLAEVYTVAAQSPVVVLDKALHFGGNLAHVLRDEQHPDRLNRAGTQPGPHRVPA